MLGGLLGTLLAMLRGLGGKPARMAIDAYVELTRNTPFLVQMLIIFFGLPSIGVRMSAEQAALLAIVLNLGAYSTEIVRAGIESVHKSQIEAGLSLAMTRWQTFRYVVLAPAIAQGPPVDLDAAATAIAAVTAVAAQHPEISELEVNPLLATRPARSGSTPASCSHPAHN